VHAAAAGAFGMPEGTLSALLADVSSAPVPERIRPLLQYLGKLILTPAKITQRTLRRCWQQGGKKRAAGRGGGVRAVQPREPAGRRAGHPAGEDYFITAAGPPKPGTQS